MLPGRLGVRFALEALFLVLLAVGAGLADLRPALIVLVMAVAWVLVAVVEFTAERISAAPLSYLLPERTAAPEGEAEPERVGWPMPEERTVVAPPQRREPEPIAAEVEVEPKPEPVTAEPESKPLPESERKPESEPQPEPERKPEPEMPEPAAAEAAAEEPAAEEPTAEEPAAEEPTAEEPAAEDAHEQPAIDDTLGLPLGQRLRSRLRRREREQEVPAPAPPRHVKLLPRRSAAEADRAAQEVAELFGSATDGEDPKEREEERA